MKFSRNICSRTRNNWLESWGWSENHSYWKKSILVNNYRPNIDASLNPAAKGMFSWSKMIKKLELDPVHSEPGSLQTWDFSMVCPTCNIFSAVKKKRTIKLRTDHQLGAKWKVSKFVVLEANSALYCPTWHWQMPGQLKFWNTVIFYWLKISRVRKTHGTTHFLTRRPSIKREIAYILQYPAFALVFGTKPGSFERICGQLHWPQMWH